jgi:hypothetical protein
VCVRERERGCVRMSVCARVCVCERERESVCVSVCVIERSVVWWGIACGVMW